MALIVSNMHGSGLSDNKLRGVTFVSLTSTCIKPWSCHYGNEYATVNGLAIGRRKDIFLRAQVLHSLALDPNTSNDGYQHCEYRLTIF